MKRLRRKFKTGNRSILECCFFLSSLHFPTHGRISSYFTYTVFPNCIKMAKRFLIFTLLLCLLFSHSLCDEEEDHWIQPSPPYNSTTIYIGEQYKIEWSSDLWKFFANNTPSADVTNSDLWISGFYEHQYAHVVTSKSLFGRLLGDDIWKPDFRLRDVQQLESGSISIGLRH